jgi:hypothetical protein
MTTLLLCNTVALSLSKGAYPTDAVDLRSPSARQAQGYDMFFEVIAYKAKA